MVARMVTAYGAAYGLTYAGRYSPLRDSYVHPPTSVSPSPDRETYKNRATLVERLTYR